MKDFATSDDPAVQAQLDRLARLSLPQGRFGLETIRALLERLGDLHEEVTDWTVAYDEVFDSFWETLYALLYPEEA